MSLPVFSELAWEDILKFKTFTADKHIDEKLESIGVSMVDNTWGDMLKTDNNELGGMIRDIMDKST